jgi:hypothetical protein
MVKVKKAQVMAKVRKMLVVAGKMKDSFRYVMKCSYC